MLDKKSLLNYLTNINKSNFNSAALRIFKWQAKNNLLYNSYINYLGLDVFSIKEVENIPFLPISFFKNHSIKTNRWIPEKIFTSSGTTSSKTSSHLIKDLDFYHSHSCRIFEQIFGPIINTHILALLPTYLERNNSSLVSMIHFFINKTNSKHSKFYLNNKKELVEKLAQLKLEKKKIILFGVTFALLELADYYTLDLSHIIVIETGGMKGQREEITRDEMHKILKEKLNIQNIYSEYGMTELLSQAYGKDAIFSPPTSMKVIIREITDPFSITAKKRTGGVNIVDLANIHTCAFIETQDLGRSNEDGSFEILGRFDNSDLRGCNLLDT